MLVRQGASGPIVPEPTAELDPQQAADLLNVSRGHLVGLLASGKIPARMSAGDRGIKAEDLRQYKRQDDAERRAPADALADLAQELDLS